MVSKNKFTIVPVAASVGAAEFADVNGVQMMFGLKRSIAYRLAADGLIRSVTLRRNGTVRGKRLFDCRSIRKYLARQPSDVLPQCRAQARHAVNQRRKKNQAEVVAP